MAVLCGISVVLFHEMIIPCLVVIKLFVALLRYLWLHD
jgi:hypothetical protein